MNHVEQMHLKAQTRFKADGSKCYQRHIRELYAELEPRPQLQSLGGAVVERISNAEAKQIITKYEWLQKMGILTGASYGLKLNGELLGVACFGFVGGKVRQICEGATPEETYKLSCATVCLQRGACVPWAPKNAASFLIRNACRQAYKDHGWKIFFAYSDSAAGEIGTVYQAGNWLFIGAGSGRPNKAFHSDYVSPDKKTTLTSYSINHGRLKLQKKFGVPDGKPFRRWLVEQGWTQIRNYSHAKARYVWFEGTGTERERLKQLCRYSFLPYPKRSIPAMQKLEVSEAA
jgi:hypothetical protein